MQFETGLAPTRNFDLKLLSQTFSDFLVKQDFFCILVRLTSGAPQAMRCAVVVFEGTLALLFDNWWTSFLLFSSLGVWAFLFGRDNAEGLHSKFPAILEPGRALIPLAVRHFAFYVCETAPKNVELWITRLNLSLSTSGRYPFFEERFESACSVVSVEQITLSEAGAFSSSI